MRKTPVSRPCLHSVTFWRKVFISLSLVLLPSVGAFVNKELVEWEGGRDKKGKRIKGKRNRR